MKRLSRTTLIQGNDEVLEAHDVPQEIIGIQNKRDIRDDIGDVFDVRRNKTNEGNVIMNDETIRKKCLNGKLNIKWEQGRKNLMRKAKLGLVAQPLKQLLNQEGHKVNLKV